MGIRYQVLGVWEVRGRRQETLARLGSVQQGPGSSAPVELQRRQRAEFAEQWRAREAVHLDQARRAREALAARHSEQARRAQVQPRPTQLHQAGGEGEEAGRGGILGGSMCSAPPPPI